MAASVLDATQDDFLGYHHFGAVPFDKTVTIAATNNDDAGDDVLMLKFPENAFLPGAFLPVQVTVPDLDTGTDLVLDFGIGDSDGVIDTVLINDTTVGQAGGVDLTDATVADWIDVGGKYFIMTVVTAGSGVAGDISVAGVYFVNKRALSA